MMKGYIAIGRQAFLEGMAFRANALMGIVDTVILIAVNVAIWKAVYGPARTIGGVGYMENVTNALIGIGASIAFSTNEYAIARKIRSGAITVDLLRPIGFQGMALASDIGKALYTLAVEFLPAFTICALLFGVLPPASPVAVPLFVASLCMGFLVIHYLSLIVSYISFWYFNIFSFATIKNTAVMVLSGAYIPYWFMPDWLLSMVRWSPFEAIYSAPMAIYLGRLDGTGALMGMGRQLAWIIALQLVARCLWRLGRGRLAVNGG